MKTNGVEGLLIETHNWGKTVAFWKALGYELEFETDHHSGQLRHPAGGPYIFIAERPASQKVELQLAIGVAQASEFHPPDAGKVLRPFEREHWGVLGMLLGDPDGRTVAVYAPMPATEEPHGA
jgi:hypothetical protein